MHPTSLKYFALITATAMTLALAGMAQDAPAKVPGGTSDAKPAPPTGARIKKTQADAASSTAKFGEIAKTDDSYKTAIDAHALADALKQVDQAGAFKGTVTKIFEPRDSMAIVNFDPDYKTALTALLKGTNYSRFPALTNLIGKEVVVTGKFISYQGRAEIILEKPSQIKLVK